VTMYLLELSLLFGAGMLLLSAIFPLSLPPEYSPVVAGQYTSQPDWYFLWIYQVLKVSIFEGKEGLAVALSLITLVFVVLILLPFIDRGGNRQISRRPIYTTLGLIFIGEVLLLSYWGYVSPGSSIPVEQAALVIGGTAVLIAIGSIFVYRTMYSRAKSRLPTAPASLLPKSEVWTGVAFTVLVSCGALTIGSTFNSLVAILTGSQSLASIATFITSVSGLALVVLGTAFLIYRLDFRTGNIGRRIKFFERGAEK
jgi:hypothetical protein